MCPVLGSLRKRLSHQSVTFKYELVQPLKSLESSGSTCKFLKGCDTFIHQVGDLDSGEDTVSWLGHLSASLKLVLKLHLSSPFCLLEYFSVTRTYE